MSDRSVPRRGFIVGGVTSGFALALAPSALATETPEAGAPAPIVYPEFPSQDPERVREVVAVSHTNVDRVRELVGASPALAKAAVDWGFGDWESALGAASHMGRRDIAELLMEHGARPNVFTFAMLGQLDAVKSCVAAMPGIQLTRGPHDITLLRHAKSGGEAAKPVVAYLESLGDADVGPTRLAVGDDEKKIFLGRYVFGPGEDDTLEVLTNQRGSLAIKRGDRFSRALNRVEEHAFAPGGAPAVRVRFAVREGKAVALTVHDPHPIVTAKRSG